MPYGDDRGSWSWHRRRAEYQTILDTLQGFLLGLEWRMRNNNGLFFIDSITDFLGDLGKSFNVTHSLSSSGKMRRK